MALGPLFKSVGKEALERIQGSSIKKESVEPGLKKFGATNEEIDYAGVPKFLALETGSHVEKDSLVDLFSDLSNQFGITKLSGRDALYADTGLAILPGNTKANATYSENLITFGATGRYSSPHFRGGPRPRNYLMHTRSQIDKLNGKDTNLVVEIQSDLHQQGRALGYNTPADTERRLSIADLYRDVMAKPQLKSASAVPGLFERARGLGIEIERRATREQAANVLYREYMRADKPPTSPWEKTWLKKGLETELASAYEKGVDSISVPIEGQMIHDLKRGQGVQYWYETTVIDTMKKIAKQQGAKFEMVDEAPDPSLFTTKFEEALKTNELSDELREELRTKWGLPSPTVLDDYRRLEAWRKDPTSNRANAPDIPNFWELKGVAGLVDSKRLSQNKYARITLASESVPGHPQYKKAAEYEAEHERLMRSLDMLRYLNESKPADEKQAADMLKSAFGSSETEAINRHFAGDTMYNFEPSEKYLQLEDELGVHTDDWVGTIQILNDKPRTKLKKPEFTLFAAAPATVLAAYLAYKSGKSPDGFSEEVLEYIPLVEEAKEQGYSDEEISAKISQLARGR